MAVVSGSNPVIKHLHEAKVKDLIPEQKQIFTIKLTDSIEAAVKLLTTNKLQALPVVDANGAFVGFVDMLDIATYIIACAPHPKELQANTLDALKIAGRTFSLVSLQQLFRLRARNKSPTYSLLDSLHADAALHMLADGAHRVALYAAGKEANVSGVVAAFDLGKWLSTAFTRGSMTEMGAKSVRSFGYGECDVYTVDTDATVLTAIQKLAMLRISALAVVDKDGALVGNFSATDVQQLYADRWPHLTDSIGKFLEAHSPAALKPKTANIDDSLANNVKAMVDGHLHHLWVVNDKKVPIGVFSLTDAAQLVANYVEKADK